MNINEGFTKADAVVGFDDNQAYYDTNIFTLEVGDVIFLKDSKRHYETFVGNLSKFVSDSSVVDSFSVYPITPGSQQFAQYGSGCFEVIVKLVP